MGTLHVLAAVAEAEAEMISARTKSALEAARKRGVKLGGLRRNSAAIGASGAAASVMVRQHRARENARNLLPAIEEMGDGLSLHEIARRLNEGGFNAPRGGLWSAAQVGRVLALADG